MTHEKAIGGPRVFGTREERDQWQIETYGKVRNGWREPGEQPDSRPIIRRDPFWEDQTEQAAFEAAIRKRPIKTLVEDGHFAGFAEGTLDYLREIVKRATGKDVEVGKPMPLARIPGEDG